MKKVLAIFALCLFGFYGAMQGQALAGSADRKISFEGKKVSLMTQAKPQPTNPAPAKSGDVKKP